MYSYLSILQRNLKYILNFYVFIAIVNRKIDLHIDSRERVGARKSEQGRVWAHDNQQYSTSTI